MLDKSEKHPNTRLRHVLRVSDDTAKIKID
jgi:hypothetical protein